MKPGRPAWRKWLLRLGIGILALALLLAVFHRPIFFEGTWYFILRAAKQQNLDLSYEMDGSIFTTLSVRQLKATPTESGPIQRLEIGAVNLRYSLWDLIRKGLPAFLQEVELKNVFVELTPGEPLPPEKDAKPQAFKFPALFPATLILENVNLVSHAPTGDTVLEGFSFSLLPDRSGAFEIRTLDLPGVHRWTEIRAATSYRDRDLKLTNLQIGTEIALREFQLDLSDLEKNELRAALDGTFFDAPLSLSLRVTDLNATNQLTLQVEAGTLKFEPVWKYLNLAIPLEGELTHLTVAFAGEPGQPVDWTGNVQAELTGLKFESRDLGKVDLAIVLADGQAKVDLKNELDDRNSLTVKATAKLPDKPADFARTPAQGQVALQLPEAGTLPLPEAVVGDLAAIIDFNLAEGNLTAKGAVDSEKLAAAGAELTATHVTFEVAKDLTQPADAPVFQTLKTQLQATVATVRSQDYVTDALNFKVTTNDADIRIEDLSLAKAGNLARLTADYALPADLKSWDAQPLKFDLAVEAPELGAFVAPGSAGDLKGKLQISAKGEVLNRVINGAVSIEGSEIVASGLPVKVVQAQIALENNKIRISRLNLDLNDQNRVQGEGEVQLGEALEYWGNLNVSFDDLAVFQPLLGPDPKAPTLGGKLKVNWTGNGGSPNKQHFGAAYFDLTGGRFGDQKNLTAHFSANYSPNDITLPDFLAASDLANVGFALRWMDNRLRISNLAIRQKQLTLVEGTLDLPLHLAEAPNFERMLPPAEPLSANLKASKVELRKVFEQLGEKQPPFLGTVNLDLSVQGTLETLTSRLALSVANLQATSAEQFAPANIDVNVALNDNRLTLDGSVRQKLIQPLRLSGNLPFNAAAVLRAGAIDPQTPIDFRVSLPRSSLAFVSSLVPAIRQSRGNATIDVRASGTVAAPVLAGEVAADLEALRFTDPSLPPIDRFALRMNFSRDRVTITRCVGGIAGGTFGLGGAVTYSNPQKPTLDLRLTSKNALALQNDDLTVRVSSDIRITGPLDAGSVQGNVWVTRSRFYRNIDILPIGLPGRPAPQPPAEPVVISFPTPPLRDWKFDVAIRTADPFLVQSNLANGRILIDLRLGGTGKEPWMDGTINIERLTASLPFSRLNIDSGQIFFNRLEPFVPQLNLRGTSTIRDYHVTVFITGPVTAPEAIFTSDPALPQAEVVSLLATGMTTNELTRDPNALAGRAAILLFQKLYRSVFQRNQPPPENDSFLSRIRFDIGASDPKTGRQSATLGIPLSEQIMLTGGLDVGGNFRGQIKYLIRFK